MPCSCMATCHFGVQHGKKRQLLSTCQGTHSSSTKVVENHVDPSCPLDEGATMHCSCCHSFRTAAALSWYLAVTSLLDPCHMIISASSVLQTGLPMTGLAVAGAQYKLSAQDRQLLQQQYLPWALRAGSKCTDLMTPYYEKHFKV